MSEPDLTMASDPLIKRDPPYAWVMVAVAFLLTALSFGGLGSVGIFLKPLIAEFGWSRGETAMGYTALSLSAGVLGIVWGIAADRWGSRPVVFIGCLAMPLAFYLLSQTATLGQFYFFYIIFGGFGFATLMSPLTANVSFWFEYKKGLAIGLAAAGGAAGQGVIPFCTQLLINEYGWQSAYMTLAVCYLVLGFPLAIFIREAPARLAARGQKMAIHTNNDPDYPVSPNEAVAWISAAAVFCCICMAVPIVHIVALVSDRGESSDIAASVLMVLMLAAIIGRILGGMLGDKLGALQAYMLLSFCQTVLVIWFPHVVSLEGTYILAILFGIAYSGDMVSFIICVRVMVPAAMAGRALGIVGFFGMIGMGTGGYLGGLLFDLSGGDYFWSFTMASMAGIINLIILALFYMRRKRMVGRMALGVA